MLFLNLIHHEEVGGINKKVNVTDYGMGNLRSICNALKHLGAEPLLANTPSKVKAEKVIIPGVGAFGDGMSNLMPFIPKIKEFLHACTNL